MSNKVTYGLEQIHIAFKAATSTDEQPEWETPVHITGAVRWTPTTQGQSTTFYADNGPYFVLTTNDGYTAEMEQAIFPATILARMLGWLIDDNGMLVEVTPANPEPFALLGQVQGDQKNRRFVYYNCTAQRPAKEHTTQNETITPATDVLPVTVLPQTGLIPNKRIVRGDLELSDTNATAYNGFFEAVYTPVVSEGD